MNGPRDKVFEWFVGPLLVIKEQLKRLHLDESEENCLRELFIRCRNEKPDEWDGTEFASSDRVRRAQLQSIIRRYSYLSCYLHVFYIKNKLIYPVGMQLKIN